MQTLTTTTVIENDEIFTDYSKAYDMMLKINPAYQELQSLFKLQLQKLQISKNAPIKVLDIGGGTGNFSVLVKEYFPNCQITLLEPNSGMIDRAKTKLPSKSMDYDTTPFEKWDTSIKYDLVICMHALYLMPNPKLLIPKIVEHMAPGASALICDIGKPINVLSWSIYLFQKLIVRYGLNETINYFRQGKQISEANKKISKLQRKKNPWEHNLSQFKLYFSQYLTVHDGFSCYRGYSNFVRCVKE